MQATLDPTGRPVRVDDLVIRTRGLSGTVVTLPDPSKARTRGAAGVTSDLDAALRRGGMRTTHLASMDLSVSRRRKSGTSRGGGAAGDEARNDIVVEVPAPASGWEQVVLSVDEHGVMNWHFAERPPEPAPGERRTRARSRRTRRYVLSQPPPGRRRRRDGQGTTRSLAGEIGKRVVKVIAFKVGKYVGKKAQELARDWEKKNRPDGVRSFERGSSATVVPYYKKADPAWKKLGSGRALLFIHGTFGRTHTAMAAFPEPLLERLHAAYGGRIFAFDHRTVSDDPEVNIRFFLDQVPKDVKLELDVVCHSRGGLVARTLAERAAELGGGRVKVRRIVLVAVPSEGTILASVENWNKLLDTFTSLVNMAGGPGLGDAIDVILAAVRQIVVTGYEEIRGLHCMMPGSPFLQVLNGQKRNDAIYYALASNFEPASDDFAALIQDEALDLLHGSPNDLLVTIPSATGAGPNGRPAPFAPVDEQFVLEPPGSIEHSSYFGRADLMNRMVGWLEAGLP